MKPRTMLLETRCKPREVVLGEPFVSEAVLGRDIGMSVGMAGENFTFVVVVLVAEGEGCSRELRLAFMAFHFSASVVGASRDSMRLFNESGERCFTACRRGSFSKVSDKMRVSEELRVLTLSEDSETGGEGTAVCLRSNWRVEEFVADEDLRDRA